jgi:hypothetical protein
MVLNKELKEAFDKVIETKRKVFEIGEEELTARGTLKFRENELLLQGKEGPIKGTNDKLRDAQLKEQTIGERNHLESLEKEKRGAQFDHEIARLNLECLQWQIRNEQATADLEAQGFGEI